MYHQPKKQFSSSARTKSVLTIASGKLFYLNMAVALARSFLLWNGDNDIDFILATDIPHAVPNDIQSKIDVLELLPNEYGKGFSPKLHIDQFSKTDQTLFIDADCLVVSSLLPVFERFSGYAVATVGDMHSSGEWFGNIAARCRNFNVSGVPVFVGSLYYFERGPTSAAVFATARSLEIRYDEIGMIRLRHRPNEEPLISLAMALHHQLPILDDGSIKADAMHFPSYLDVDVFAGNAYFKNDQRLVFKTSSLYEARPIIAHLNDSFAEHTPYTREAYRLKKVMADGWPLWSAKLASNLRHTVPELVLKTIKSILRPIYHRIFGYRSIKKSERIID
ncbi:hypothetical protein BH10CHL1_BH10CHL1_45830 [soil metagenome]